MEDTKARTPRRVKIALGVSLAINLLVLGAVVGAFMHGDNRDRRDVVRRGGDNAAIGIYGRALDRADRRAIGQRLREGRKVEGREIRAELGDLAQQASELLKQSPFNKEAFADVLLQQQGLIKGRSDTMQDALVERIASMTDEQRIAYADRLQDLLDRGTRRDGKKGP